MLDALAFIKITRVFNVSSPLKNLFYCLFKQPSCVRYLVAVAQDGLLLKGDINRGNPARAFN